MQEKASSFSIARGEKAKTDEVGGGKMLAFEEGMRGNEKFKSSPYELRQGSHIEKEKKGTKWERLRRLPPDVSSFSRTAPQQS